MAKVYVALTAIATLAFGLFSCSGGEGNNPLATTEPITTTQASSTLKYLDIQNAKSLYISGGSGTSSNKAAGINASTSGSVTKKIFKITDEDHIEELKYLDANKKEITITNQPAAICSVNSDYIFVGFGNNSYFSTGYLVRKSDGAVFDMKNAGMPFLNNMGWINAPFFHTDKKNNMYYIIDEISSVPRKIIRVNLSGEVSLASVTVSPSTDSVTWFEVDKDGNIIYEGRSINTSKDFLRIRKNTGGLKNISANSYWIGLDDCIYIRDSSHIKKITIDAEDNVTENDYGILDNSYFYRWGSYKLNFKTRIIIICGNSISEVYNPSSSPRTITLTGLTLNIVTDVKSTENFYYIAGKDNSGNTILIKVNPENDSWTNLLPDNNYELYTFTASETDGITFNALRLSDGKKIIGKVGINGGGVTVIDEESNAQISYLERIN